MFLYQLLSNTPYRPCASRASTMPPTKGDIDHDYLVTPETGPGPGIIVLHSGRGVTQFVHQFCHRLAREGFVTVAPDLFRGETPRSVTEAQEQKAELDERTIGRRLEDTAAFLLQHDAVSRRSIGVIGLGYGAEWACTLASRLGDECGALVLFYGVRETDWQIVSAPILGHFAHLDHAIPISRVNELRDVFQEHGIDHDLFVYSDTEPSFLETDETARHDVEAARLAWERTLEFLRKHLQTQNE